MVTSVPFWSRPRVERTAAVLPARVDVLVVGGGITGVSLLRELTARGADSVLVERDYIASAASGRNAGFLLTGVSDCYATACGALGREVAAEVWAFTAENHELLLEALGSARTRAAGHQRTGAWTLATTLDEAALLRESAQLLVEDGLSGTWVDAPVSAPPGHHGGLLVPGDGAIDPATAVGALADTVSPRVAVGVEVVGIETASGSVRVHTTRGELIAGAVVLATNAYTPLLVPGVPIQPVRAQMLATVAAPAQLERRPTYAHRGHRYWRQVPGGEVLVGGWRDVAVAEEVGYEPAVTERVQRELDSWLGILGVGAKVTHRWAGIMGFTPDGLPLVGAVPAMPGIHVCGGYTGHGMGFAVHAARSLARALCGGPPPPAWAAPERFEPVAGAIP
jgi:gamma-glutamylputrescine oxidase